MGCSSPSTKDNDNENIMPSDKINDEVFLKQKGVNFDNKISTLKQPEIKKKRRKNHLKSIKR